MYKNILNILNVCLLLLRYSFASSAGDWETIPSDCESEYLYIDECFPYGDLTSYDPFKFLRSKCRLYDRDATLASINTAQVQNELFALVNQEQPQDGDPANGGVDCEEQFSSPNEGRWIAFAGLFTSKTATPGGPTAFSKMEYTIEWDNGDRFTPNSLAFGPTEPNFPIDEEEGIWLNVAQGLIADVPLGGFTTGDGAAIMCQRPIVDTCIGGDKCSCLDGKSCAPPETPETRGSSIIDIIASVRSPEKCCDICKYDKYCKSWSYVKKLAFDHGHALHGLHLWSKDCVLYNTKCYITDDITLQSGFPIKEETDNKQIKYDDGGYSDDGYNDEYNDEYTSDTSIELTEKQRMRRRERREARQQY